MIGLIRSVSLMLAPDVSLCVAPLRQPANVGRRSVNNKLTCFAAHACPVPICETVFCKAD